LVGTLVIDPDGAYDPRLVNDRLLLGLKGTMSEYELSLLRQRGIEARDSKAKRGELRFALPPGYCWDELGRIEKDPDERVRGVIELVLRKFQELGSARQVTLHLKDANINLPVARKGPTGRHIFWRAPAYHTVREVLVHPIYAGAYVFGRTGQRMTVVDGRARKTEGHKKPMAAWNVLIRDHHPGYLTWEAFEKNQLMLSENAHMQKRMARKSARGGRALLTGLVRCGRCARMMRVFYGMGPTHAHRYHCPGDSAMQGMALCIGIGGVRVDRALAAAIVEAVSGCAVEAAWRASDQVDRAAGEIRQSILREVEEAKYDATVASRRYEAVDPTKRLVARELEHRWNACLERVAELEGRLRQLDAEQASRPKIDSVALTALARDLPTVWNNPSTDPRTKQRITRILIQEVIVDLDDATHEAVLTVHWTGGRHTEIRVARTRTGRYPEERHPSPVEAMRKLGGHWPDRQLAVTMNRMRCQSSDGRAWTAVRVRELRERLGIAAFDANASKDVIITADEAARRLKVWTGSIHALIREGVLPATQLMPSAPWQIPAAALNTDAVKIGVRKIIARRPRNLAKYREDRTLKLPGI